MKNSSLTQGHIIGKYLEQYFKSLGCQPPFFAFVLTTSYLENYKNADLAWRELKIDLDNHLIQMVTQYNILENKIKKYYFRVTDSIPGYIIVYAHNAIVFSQFNAISAWGNYFLPYLDLYGIPGFNTYVDNLLKELERAHGL